MSLHHKYGPSALPALSACPCYKSNPKGSEAAEKGTFLHSVFENLFHGTLKHTIEHNEEFKKDFTNSLDSDLAGVQWAFEETREIIASALHIPSSEVVFSEMIESGTLRIEERVSVIDENFEELNFGTLDLWFCSGDIAILFDLKTGRRRNYLQQMANYALAKFQECPTLPRINSVILYSQTQTVECEEFTEESASKIFFDVFKKVNDADKKTTPCEYCSWCADRQSCEALLSGVDLVRKDRSDIFPEGENFRSSEVLKLCIEALKEYEDAATQPVEEERLKNAIAELSKHGKHLAYMLNTAKVAASYLEGVENSIKEAVRAGVPVPGFKLQKRAAKAEIGNIQGLYNSLNVSPELFLSACNVSITKLVAAIPEEKTEAIILDSGVKIPTDFFKKKGTGILKSNLKKSFDIYLEEMGLISRGPDSFSVVADKPKA